MSDYRQKLVRMVEETGKYIFENAETLSDLIDHGRYSIASQPLIRCKDCKHQVKEWRDDKRLKDKGYWVCGCEVVGDACGYWALLGQDEDFCSYAERRTDETDYRKE